jgi:Na+/H+-dicarboxylate symporter
MLNQRSYLWMLIAIALAIVAGWLEWPILMDMSEIGAEIFVRLLKLISLPIISLSLLATISSVGEHSLSRLGKRIVTYTILTTTIAATIAFLLYETIKPVTVITDAIADPQEPLSYLDEFLKLIPDNIVQPFLEGNVVSIMLLSLLIGFGIAKLPKAQREPLSALLQSLFMMMMQITRWIVSLMPFAIWAFVTDFVVELRHEGLPFAQLAWYLTTIVSANLIQALIVLPLLLVMNKIPPFKVFTKMLPALSFAFFSKSSSAAMPVAIDCAEQKLQVNEKVARFSFPLCTSINMNACAAFILITVFFVSQSHGLQFELWEKIAWIGIATVAAIGNAGVPMGCFFIASALLTTMNVPLTLMGVILPFYALLDMLESAINIWSDACVTMIVNEKSKHDAIEVISDEQACSVITEPPEA